MLRVTAVATGLPGSPYYMTLYFDGTTQDAAEDATANVKAALDNLASITAEFMTWEVNPTVEHVNPVNNQVLGIFVTTVSGVTTGDEGSDPLPPGTCAIVQFLTGVYNNGRQIRGKIFYPGLTAAALASDGTINDDAWLTLRGTFDGLMLTDEPNGVVFSRTHGLAQAVTAVTMPRSVGFLKSRRV